MGTDMNISESDQILLRIQEIVRGAIDDPDVTLTRATVAKDVAGWDSIMEVMIIIEVEKNFGIKLRSKEIDRLTCVGDLVDVVAQRKAL